MTKKSLQQFKKNFLSNLPFKIGAVLIAFLLWFVIMNTTDPVATHPVDVRLTIRNINYLPPTIALANENNLRNQSISIFLRGTNREIEAIGQNLTAYIDLSDASILNAVLSGIRHFSTEVQVYGFGENAALHSHTPTSVRLEFVDIATRDVEVSFAEAEADAIDPNIYIAWDEAAIYPNVLAVSGPTDAVGRVYRFVINVNLEGLTEDWQRFGFTPTPVDYFGNTVVGDLQFGNVSVNLPVYHRGNVQILPPAVEGVPASGFGVGAVNINMQSIAVAGHEDAIASLQTITLPPISAANEAASFAVSYNIADFLPTGVFVINENHRQITANVIIEPIITQSFSVPRGNIFVSGTQYYEILTPQITFSISGMESIVEAIENIPVSVNLFGLEDGEHVLSPSFNLPNGVQLAGLAPTIVVRIGDDYTGGNGYNDIENGTEMPYYEENGQEGYGNDYGEDSLDGGN